MIHDYVENFNNPLCLCSLKTLSRSQWKILGPVFPHITSSFYKWWMTASNKQTGCCAR